MMEFIREEMKKESFARQILPPQAITVEDNHDDVFADMAVGTPAGLEGAVYDPFSGEYSSPTATKGPYLTTITADCKDLPMGKRFCSPQMVHVPDQLLMPAWRKGLSELDAQFRGMAVNLGLLDNIHATVKNLVATAAAVGDITAQDHRDVLYALKVITPESGCVEVHGLSLLEERYLNQKRLRETFRSTGSTGGFFTYEQPGVGIGNIAAVAKMTKNPCGEVPLATYGGTTFVMPVGTRRIELGVTQVWTGSAWVPESTLMLVSNGFYTHAPSKRMAYVLGTGHRRGHTTSATLAFMQWVDTTEMFYTPVEEFGQPGIWEQFQG